MSGVIQLDMMEPGSRYRKSDPSISVLTFRERVLEGESNFQLCWLFIRLKLCKISIKVCYQEKKLIKIMYVKHQIP